MEHIFLQNLSLIRSNESCLIMSDYICHQGDFKMEPSVCPKPLYYAWEQQI